MFDDAHISSLGYLWRDVIQLQSENRVGVVSYNFASHHLVSIHL